MAEIYRIIGSDLSPYSVKVRSYFRYRGLPHEWLIRNPAIAETFERYARLPLVPLVITPDGEGWQDSTPIIERLEAALRPDPPLAPDDPALAFISALIEDYGDEWVNKPMFHYRWTYEPDQVAASRWIAAGHMGASGDNLDAAAEKVRARMVPRLSFVGSSPETRPLIEASLDRLFAILEAHLKDRPFLLGGRPAMADFGLSAQIHECGVDPTAGAILRERAPTVLAWTERMLDPIAEGPFEAWDALSPTLMPLLSDEIGAVFLPWSQANAKAIAAGTDTFTVTLSGGPFTQTPQKYHARSLAEIRRKYAAVADRGTLDPILAAAGCLEFLSGDEA